MGDNGLARRPTVCIHTQAGSSRFENSSGFMRTKILIHYGGSNQILYMA